MSFGTQIECPSRSCKGIVNAEVQSLEPLVYTYNCPECNRGGMWDKLVQLKNKVSRNSYGHKHSFPKTQADEINLATKRVQKKKLDSEYERVTFIE